MKINNVESKHLTYSQSMGLYKISLNERLWIGLGIIAVLLVTLADVVEDFGQNQSVIMILGDILYMAAMLALLAYLWRYLPRSLKKANVLLTREVVRQHRDAQAWQEKAADVIRGFSQLITRQLAQWHLSEAEKDIAILLLKGLSIKEIALLRGTSANTVRQQAASLYAKAGLASRAELAAFFLEDLLVVEEREKSLEISD